MEGVGIGVGKEMEINKESLNIKQITNHVGTVNIPISNRMEVFTFTINANKFDYQNACEYLLESVCNFALSRQLREEYSDKPMKLTRKAREKFKDWKKNTGELGEFLLFCFLEGHLEAPKILSKLELKTSTEMYVNGADGLHYLKLPNGNYQLIFGESKLYRDLTDGLRNAFKSIHDFKNGINANKEGKSGITFEKGLLADNLQKEINSKEEKDFLTKLIYPTSDKGAPKVDDAFGIFVGYEMDYENERKSLNNEDFRNYIDKTVKNTIDNKTELIKKYVDEYDLHGYVFYIYILPFSKLDESREMMIKELVK